MQNTVHHAAAHNQLTRVCIDRSMAADDRSEEREAELELLRAMYAGEDELTIADGPHGTKEIAIRLLPHSGGNAAQRFMEATLAVSLPTAYPDELPTVSIARARGLLDEEERELLAGVQAEAVGLVGECCVYPLLVLPAKPTS